MARVLVVDDNDDVRETTATLIDVWGHEVATAGTGHAALAAFESFPADVVLLDLGLDGSMSGTEVARQIRALGGWQPFIIALTGWTRPSDREAALRAGADAFVLKPPDLDALKTSIELAVVRQSQRG
jgi:CheY-like chemotaxis protein